MSQSPALTWYVIGEEPSALGELALSSYKCLKNLTILFEEGGEPDALILALNNKDELNQCINAIRHHDEFYLIPLFIASRAEIQREFLVDGIASDVVSMTEIVSELTERALLLPQDDTATNEEKKLLRYLYTRPHLSIKCHFDVSNPYLVCYPMLDFFFLEEADYYHQLVDLERRSVLSPLTLHDEVQSCPVCEGCLLNFKNVCPKCQSIRIESQQFIHCFTCGFTAPESKFIVRDILECQNCHQKLRHIGIDYDRPVEDLVCHECNHTFMDPDVRVSCLNCTKSFEPTALETRKLYFYKIGERGIRMAKNQFDSELYQLKDNFNYVSNEYFYLFLSWTLAMCQRHKEMTFSLLAINVSNQKLLINDIGAREAHNIIEELFKALRQLLRTTDLCTRYQDEYVVFLCPQTSDEDVKNIDRKVKTMVDGLNESNEYNVSISSDYISSDNKAIIEFDERLLIAELLSRLNDE